MSVEEQLQKIEKRLEFYCSNSYPEFCGRSDENRCDKCKINYLKHLLAVSEEKNRQLSNELNNKEI